MLHDGIYRCFFVIVDIVIYKMLMLEIISIICILVTLVTDI